MAADETSPRTVGSGVAAAAAAGIGAGSAEESMAGHG